MTIFWILFACVLQTAVCLRCDPEETKKVVLKVFVEHHQQSLTSASSYLKTISSSSSYKSAYDSLSASASVSGSYGGFSGAASAAYSEVNSLTTSSSNYNYREEGKTRTYNPKQLQISREVTTTVIIGARSSKVYVKRFVNSTPLGSGWSSEKLHQESVKFLKNKFYGEDSKIRGTTYTSETCQPLFCGRKCKENKKIACLKLQGSEVDFFTFGLASNVCKDF